MSNSSSSHSKNGSTNDTSTKLTSSASSIPQTSDIISNLIEEANRLKLEGNSYFTTQNYEAAQVSYSRALKVIQSLSNFVQTRNENANTADTTGGKSGYQGHFHRIISMRVTLCSNQSHALNNLGKYEEADTLCTEILSILENHILNLETIEDSLTWSQNKLKYRRAIAREAMGKLEEAQMDLRDCFQIIDTLSKTKNEFPKHASLRDINNVLQRIQTKISPMINNSDSNTSSMDTGQDGNTNRRITHHVQASNTNILHDNDVEVSRDKKLNPQQSIPIQENDGRARVVTQNVASHSTAAVSKACDKRMDDRIKESHKRSSQIKESKNYEICPPPDKQRQVVMSLLEQNSPVQEGEAYFLIHFKWWSKWCTHVNFFIEYEYNYTVNQEKIMRHDEWQQQMKSLQQERKKILRRLPHGAIIPNYLLNGAKKAKKKRSYSDCSSTNVSGDDSSTDDSEYDSDSNLYLKYGYAPGIINNSLLQITFPPHQSKMQQHQNDSKSAFYLEWNSLINNRREQNGGEKFVLRPHLVQGHHYELLPREVYAALRCWYGESTPSIFRRVVTMEGKKQLILYPELQKRSYSFGMNGQYQKNSNFCGACRSNAALRCSNCRSICYCQSSCQASHWPYHKAQCNVISRQKMKRDNSIIPQNLSLDPRQDPKWGRVGLNNLGNTCFMNSALQCLSHVAPLTKYFLTNHYKNDLNISNPLGAGGKLASAFDTMIKQLWMCREKNSISPTDLKRAIATFAPRFSGMSQHDSQEFLAFLLDGLHEDLNTIKNPPYFEMPDVTGDHKLTVAGEEAWDAHCLRNRSVVMDTFYGQFKSTCICPICDKVSVSFEPFNHISLEIPQSKHDPTCDLPVLLFSTSSQSSVPVRYAINIDKNACMRDVKVGLSKMTGLSCDRIVLCEVYQHKICEIYTDEIEIRKVDKETLLVGYELDPYSNSTIHTISFQSTFKKISQSEDNETAIQTYSVGYPIFTSFDIDLTCSEVWHHFFLQISYVFPELSDAEIETLFHLKIVDNNGKPRQIFRTSEIESDDACCIVSKTDKKSLTSYLEEDCAESFLFVEIEWNLKNSRCKIHDTHFDIYSTHSSVDNAIGKQRTFDSTITLENCLERFTFPERLDEDNKWYCSLCRKHVRAKKTMELWRLPNILIVHLKRFAFKNSYRREKLETFVHYPLEGLDLEKYCTSDSNQPMSGDQAEFVINDETDAGYDLFGVVNHYGRMGYGHYTAFARRWSKESIDDDWISFDDSSVRRIPKEQVVSANAYMLFYRRRVFT